MKTIVIGFILIGYYSSSFAQPKGIKNTILSINRAIDEGIVSKNLISLDTLYASDFVFSHGTGFVEAKKSWLENVAKRDQVFISRIQDSTSVEIHPDLVIVKGKLAILRKDNEKHVSYGLWYVRVFATREKYWQLVSHVTTKEWHY